jgi:hypothetical protein
MESLPYIDPVVECFRCKRNLIDIWILLSGDKISIVKMEDAKVSTQWKQLPKQPNYTCDTYPRSNIVGIWIARSL